MASNLIQVVIYFPTELLALIDMHTKENNLPRAEWVRQACKEKLERDANS